MIKLLTSLVSCIVIYYNYRNKRVISSSSVWVFCYVLIFILYPLCEKNIIYQNAFLIDVLALIGIIAFTIGDTVGSRFVINKTRNIQIKIMFPKYKIAYILFWLFCIASILVLIQQIGTSGILAVFNGAVTSKELVLGKDVSMEIFIFVVHLLVPCILTLWMTAETKRQKINAIIALTIYIMETLLFGFTRIFLISILGMILLYEIRKKGQKKQIMIVSLGLVALVLLMVMMNFIRTFGLQSERDISSIFDIEYIFNSTDFSASYYWLDELLNFDSPFINPIVYLKPIFAMVPRSIWETKPEPLSLQILRYVNPARAATGYSTAGNTILGEGYAIMSWLGVFVAPFIWGTICGKMDKAYYRRLENGADHSLQNIFYYIFAIFIVISGQRGDWSQYIMIVIWFYMLPMYIMSKVSSRMRN